MSSFFRAPVRFLAVAIVLGSALVGHSANAKRRGSADDRPRDHQANHHAGWLNHLMWFWRCATHIPAMLRDKFFDMAGTVRTIGGTQHCSDDIQ